MAYTHYERLSTRDLTLLEMETANAHLSVAAVSIFEAGSLWSPETGLDIELLENAVASRLHRIPRYRQRIAHTPLERHPIWVDDPRFNIRYHVRHTRLPRPASERQLKRLAGRILSQELDRGKPLWEMWFIEGLEDDRVALVTKVHQCAMDDLAGVERIHDRLQDSTHATAEPAPAWIPRPAPGWRALGWDDLVRRPRELLRAGRGALAKPRRTLDQLRDAAAGLGDAAALTASTTPATPLNGPIGPHRRIDWTQVALADAEEVKRRLGGTVHDVVLATIAGALGRYLEGRGVATSGLDLRALLHAPPATPGTRRARPGGRAASLVVELPIAQMDPRGRLQRVVRIRKELQNSKLLEGTRAVEKLSSWTLPRLYVRLARRAHESGAYHLVVSHVSGPASPRSLLGARQLETYPLVPLYETQAISIGVVRYAGRLFWGFNSDWDSLPDLHDLVECVEVEFERLRKAAAEA